MIDRIKRHTIPFFIGIVSLLTTPSFAFAQTPGSITDYTHTTLTIITSLASLIAVFFLIKGGYLYMTSVGNPLQLLKAKRTIIQAGIGLIIVLCAHVIVGSLIHALPQTPVPHTTTQLSLTDLQSVKPNDGLTQVLIDAISGVLQNIVQSGTKPILDSIITYLASTPSLVSNQTIFHFWLVMVGITDSLFVVIVALLGLHVMSSESLGFEQIELHTLLPKLALAFLGANVSLFLADYVITTCNTLVSSVISTTGGLDHAWVVNAISFQSLLSPQQPIFISLVFLLLFLMLATVLLFMYIGRIIVLALAGVLSPFIFLLWVLPKFSDFAEISIKSYIVSVFTIFVHVVVIELASAFLANPASSGNSLLGIVIAIGLFLTLLKVPGVLYQLIFYTSGIRSFRSLGGQILNVMTTHREPERIPLLTAMKRFQKE